MLNLLGNRCCRFFPAHLRIFQLSVIIRPHTTYTGGYWAPVVANNVYHINKLKVASGVALR